MAWTNSRARNGRVQDLGDDAVTQYDDSIGHLLDLERGRGRRTERRRRSAARRRTDTSRRSVSRADRLEVGSSRTSTLTWCDSALAITTCWRSLAGSDSMGASTSIVQPGVLGDHSGCLPCPPGTPEQSAGAGRQRVEREVVGDGRARARCRRRSPGGPSGCRRGGRREVSPGRTARRRPRPFRPMRRSPRRGS